MEFDKLYNEDCIQILKEVEKDSIDLVFADPPYFLSNGGVSYSCGKVVSVNKGEWDKSNKEDARIFTRKWLIECKRVLKNDGSIWISGTHHNIFDVGYVLNDLDFKIINFITWNKNDPPPLIYKNKFRFSAEYIIWAKKGYKHTFNYDEMFKIENKEMNDVWVMNAVSMTEKKHGKHPTQKPINLLKRIILASSNEGDIVLDPFMGSGTTCVAAKMLNRKFIGIEKEKEFYELAIRRIDAVK